MVAVDLFNGMGEFVSAEAGLEAAGREAVVERECADVPRDG